MLLQDRDDLLIRIVLALHSAISFALKYKEIPDTAWLELQRYGQHPSLATGVATRQHKLGL